MALAIPVLPEDQESGVGRVVMFDGVCNLCNGFVNFTIDRDPAKRFKFCALQSDKGQELLRRFGMPTEVNTIVYLEGTHAYQRSSAVLRVLRQLTGLWFLLYVFMLVPWFVRDLAYNLFARYRYVLFGQEESCRMPTPDLRARFLDFQPPAGARPAVRAAAVPPAHVGPSSKAD